jgi:hypothetical protein
MDEEVVKYSVLLPFMKKMILLAKNPSVTDDSIINTFDTIINNMSKISTTYTNNGAASLTVSNGTLSFLIVSKVLSSVNYINYIDNIEYHIRLRYFDGVDNFILPLNGGVNGDTASGNIVLSTQEFYKVNRLTTDELLTTFVTPKQTLTIAQVLSDLSGKPDAMLTLDSIVSPVEQLDGYESFKVTIS